MAWGDMSASMAGVLEHECTQCMGGHICHMTEHVCIRSSGVALLSKLAWLSELRDVILHECIGMAFKVAGRGITRMHPLHGGHICVHGGGIGARMHPLHGGTYLPHRCCGWRVAWQARVGWRRALVRSRLAARSSHEWRGARWERARWRWAQRRSARWGGARWRWARWQYARVEACCNSNHSRAEATSAETCGVQH